MINLLQRRSFVLVASTVIVGAIVAFGYSQLGSGSGGATGDSGPAPFKIEQSQLFITIENTSGTSLTDIRVAIVPVGRATLFTTSIGRMDGGERRDLSLGSFNGRDGTPFNLRVVRPKAIQITATDLNGKPHEMEIGWK